MAQAIEPATRPDPRAPVVVDELVIPGAGHWLAEQAPDQLAAALIEFLIPNGEPSVR